MVEYVTRDQLKNWVKIADDRDNELFDIALGGATNWIHDTTGRTFELDEAPSSRVLRVAGRSWRTDDGLYALTVPDIGTLDGLLVETGAGTSWSTVTDAETGPDEAPGDGWPITHLLRSTAWPIGVQRVRVTARWGWPAVPDGVRQACLIQAGRLFRRKDSPEGVMGGSEWGVVRVTREDPDARALLNPLSLPGFA